ncbi:MAG: GIY-YIG nuclease family protein [Candidatus Sungiibacteriota bacterium]|uniref:GIY-YIG nuclease family protein n=1 Tax=Candidatus Sungiibacteriota bacterium TaxID=2750080 RepID=A0A7T5RIV4_9BACT|nr:MAG: GIY-YIG nuclease family protein [Candidatus Sungbacteria bacterium]
MKSITAKILYTGRTENLSRRIREHNSGGTFTTKKYKPRALV